MNIAVVQMEVQDAAPDRNRRTVMEYLDANSGNDLYLLPELWTCGYVQQKWKYIARIDTPATLEWMSRQAASRKIFLGGSVIAQSKGDGLVNRFVLYNRDGRQVCQYDKAHLFRPLDEDLWLQSGTKLPSIVNVEGIRVAPAICYDLRFPEMFRRIALQGVDLFLVSSAWPVPRAHVLRILSECRAIENQTFLALSNRIGVDGQGNRFCGDSGIFGPLGTIVDAGQSKGITSIEIDMQTIADASRFLPVFSDRISGIDFL